MSFDDHDHAGEEDGAQESAGSSRLMVMAVFGGAILLLIALIYFAY